MGIFRMYTGDDGKSVIEDLQLDDPILETLKTCTGSAIQIFKKQRVGLNDFIGEDQSSLLLD